MTTGFPSIFNSNSVSILSFSFNLFFHSLICSFCFSCFHVFHAEKLCPGQHVMVDLYSASGSQKQRNNPRYSMTVVDLQHSSAKNGRFAIFIVPQGEFEVQNN